MKDLISGKQALVALANDKEVIYIASGSQHLESHWWSDKLKSFTINDFLSGQWVFRLKPQTIKIGNIDVPAPFKPEIGDEYYIIDASVKCGYSRDDMTYELDSRWTQFGAWRSESEIKQVVAVLRNLFNDQLYKDE